jgi:hypothetical protein
MPRSLSSNLALEEVGVAEAELRLPMLSPGGARRFTGGRLAAGRTIMIGIPQEILSSNRDLVEKNFGQAQEAFLVFIGAAQRATGDADSGDGAKNGMR